MSDLTLEPNFTDHPRIVSLSDSAFRAHVRAMCWSARFETDGRLSAGSVTQLTSGQVLGELLAAGLWVKNEDGSFAIRDYLQYNPSKEELEKERARKKRRARGARGGTSGGISAGRNPGRTNRSEQIEISVTDQSPDPEDHPESLGSARGRRWRRVPGDWCAKPAHRELARSMSVNFEFELERFRDHEFKDPKTDADAAFRTWLRNAPRFSASTTNGRRGPVQPSHGRTGFEDT